MNVRTWHVDAVFCALFGTASAWMFGTAGAHAAAAVREYGYNVDSGALEYAAVVVFLLPMAALFGAAAFAGAQERRWGRYLHWLAVVAAICPIAYETIVSAHR